MWAAGSRPQAESTLRPRPKQVQANSAIWPTDQTYRVTTVDGKRTPRPLGTQPAPEKTEIQAKVGPGQMGRRRCCGENDGRPGG